MSDTITGKISTWQIGDVKITRVLEGDSFRFKV